LIKPTKTTKINVLNALSMGGHFQKMTKVNRHYKLSSGKHPFIVAIVAAKNAKKIQCAGALISAKEKPKQNKSVF
jgi:hypothetical protein